MNELKTVCTFNGYREYLAKDGSPRRIPKFKDDINKEFEMPVLSEIPDIDIGQKVGCVLLFGQKWNELTKTYDKRYYFKSVVPIDE